MQETSLEQIDAVGFAPVYQSLRGLRRRRRTPLTGSAILLLIIAQAYASAKAAYASHKTRDVQWRKKQLKQLGFLIQDNEKAFEDAILKDLGRPAFETVSSEINPLKYEINEAYDNVAKWAKPKRVVTTAAWKLAKATIYPEPKGISLIIGTWNFPIALTLGPMIGAISAGCPAILKPAEQAPATATLLAELFPKYLDPQAYKVVLGAVDQVTHLLKKKFDHFFYTGSGTVGKIIARAAADHLSSVTLELGGKSPAVIFDDANVDIIARRIAWSKYANAGQICIACDYVLCTKEMQPKFIASFKKALAEFNPPAKGASSATPLIKSSGYSKIISDNHFKRLSKLLDETKGEVVIGGETDAPNRRIAVTVVANVKEDDALMEGEIFGPILPIVTLETADEWVDFINARDNPLAMYVFTQKTANRDYIFERTRSGGFVHNDTLIQFGLPGLPFGGAGSSGLGNYHGKHSFDTFSHERASASIPTWMDVLLASRYPPYSAKKLKMLLFATGETIKKDSSFGLGAVFKLVAVLVALTAGYKKLKA